MNKYIKQFEKETGCTSYNDLWRREEEYNDLYAYMCQFAEWLEKQLETKDIEIRNIIAMHNQTIEIDLYKKQSDCINELRKENEVLREKNIEGVKRVNKLNGFLEKYITALSEIHDRLMGEK